MTGVNAGMTVKRLEFIPSRHAQMASDTRFFARVKVNAMYPHLGLGWKFDFHCKLDGAQEPVVSVV